MAHWRSGFSGVLAAMVLSGCATYPVWLPSSGPSGQQVEASAEAQVAQAVIQIVDVTDAVARSVLESQRRQLFSETLKDGPAPAYVVGPGDVLEVSIWEAPPALLFGGVSLDPRAVSPASRAAAFPEQMVGSDGTITVPFAGVAEAAGKTLQRLEAEIAQRLKGKANQPQVLVRVVRNASSNVTIVGEVSASVRMPLTAKGERLLDALAAAGGVRQAVNKVSVQITRGDQVASLPLETVIQDPKQNIPLLPGDVITALHQPFSFSVLGSTGRNDEVNFEAQGITLAQALARVGGVIDNRADASGVFIFRFEDPSVMNLGKHARATTPEGRVPVVYRVDLKNPATFFVAQSFPMRNKDVMYVANAPAAELQKFLNVLVSAVYPIVNVSNATR
ncbi:MAG TPA: polysaccharide biosynthesis/export family protein [Burkholderiaceae bacterium]|nr:polysaccharide biosynthesis/export family protein [Burkholderiaceae bacterium]